MENPVYHLAITPTDDKSNLVLTGKTLRRTPYKGDAHQASHIHLTSKDDISINDWCVPNCVNESFNNKPIKFIKEAENLANCVVVSDGKKEFLTTKTLFNDAPRIVASTDESLGVTIIPDHHVPFLVYQYNKGYTEMELNFSLRDEIPYKVVDNSDKAL